MLWRERISLAQLRDAEVEMEAAEAA
jgi:hypothetical protein